MNNADLSNMSVHACYFRVIEVDKNVAGFMLAMRDGCAYENDNLAWFESRYSNFMYIDRIVIDADFAGRKLGTSLYQDAFSVALTLGLERVVSEYNWVPRNVPSEIFHNKHGFQEVGQRNFADSDKVVSMQCLELGGIN